MTRTARPPRPLLRRLARAYGVQAAYLDVDGRRRTAGEEALDAVLRALDPRLAADADPAEALHERRLLLSTRILPPTVAAWADRTATVPLQSRADRVDRPVRCELRLEDGETREWRADLAGLHERAASEVDGERYVVRDLVLPDHLPLGYHRLRAEIGGTVGRARVIVAPRRAYTGERRGHREPRDRGRRAGAGGRSAPERGTDRRDWGIFLPLHALRTDDDWGVGDTTGLARLARWTAQRGGDLVATLPLLPTFVDRAPEPVRDPAGHASPFEPSPYSPITRLFWNEVHADLLRAPGLGRCPSAQMLLNSTALRNAVERLRDEPLVDYPAVSRIKRQVLETLADCVFAEASRERDALYDFIDARARLRRYARFRALVECRGEPWTAWPEPLRSGRIAAGRPDGEERRDEGGTATDPAVARAERRHLYAQWLMDGQLESIAAESRDESAGLHLDLPLGVHPHGFDVWNDPDLFASGVSAGAPPDAFFGRGQRWGFPPLRPDAMCSRGLDYTIDCVRHHMRHAAALRIDHVMSLHRLFWVPDGLEPADGVYVRYPTEPLYAVLCLESHRHRVRLIGEDLGTVPREVRRAMGRHGVQRTWALPSALAADRTPRPPPRRSVAMLGTHDMPTFAGFWHGLDIRDRHDLGLLDERTARRAVAERARVREAIVAFLRERGRLDPAEADEPAAVLCALLDWLAAGPARTVLVALEDLWLETRPHNVPGTAGERPNWRRRARLRLDEMHRPAVLRPLESIDRLRDEENAR